MQSLPERRRSPRAVIPSESWLSLPSSWSVRLLDVSLDGVAFSSPFDVAHGRIIRFRAPLGQHPFNAQVRVCWSQRRRVVSAVDAAYEIGAAFMPLDEGDRHALEAFLRLSR